MGRRQLSTEEFIANAKAVHGDKYDYSRVNYTRSGDKVCLQCSTCELLFYVSPNNHVGKSSGCPGCARQDRALSRTKTTDQFIREAKSTHGDTYSYLDTIYIGIKGKVTVICKHHGSFQIRAGEHLQGNGCRVCGLERSAAASRYSTQDFISKAQEVHNERYDYSLSTYKNSVSKLTVVCREHGSFSILPTHHIRGTGCKKCADYGFSLVKPAHLYIFTCEDITKIGITNKEPRKRLQEIRRGSGKDFTITHSWYSEDGESIDSIETVILNWLNTNYQPIASKFNGSTECYLDVNLTLLVQKIETLI